MFVPPPVCRTQTETPEKPLSTVAGRRSIVLLPVWAQVTWIAVICPGETGPPVGSEPLILTSPPTTASVQFSAVAAVSMSTARTPAEKVALTAAIAEGAAPSRASANSAPAMRLLIAHFIIVPFSLVR
ncbi:MAG: hypothetical protein BWZ10_03126 [candidate division BRC1 bacterium ADurb.BinA364]|nr:MAG: hypothetical protein BWZ10_03126 [candidate division BRC1 bacterium ADurb.BinA364]